MKATAAVAEILISGFVACMIVGEVAVQTDLLNIVTGREIDSAGRHGGLAQTPVS
jgi:hypothetical protein